MKNVSLQGYDAGGKAPALCSMRDSHAGIYALCGTYNISAGAGHLLYAAEGEPAGTAHRAAEAQTDASDADRSRRMSVRIRL